MCLFAGASVRETALSSKNGKLRSEKDVWMGFRTGVQFPSSPCKSLENIGFSRLPLFGVIKKVISEGLICPEFRDLAQNILFYFNRFSVTVVMRFCTENIRMPHNILD